MTGAAAHPEAAAAVEVVRGSLVESRHGVAAAVVDAQGRLLWRVGEPERCLTFMRSAAKPLQALPAVEAGVPERYGFDQRSLALMCASHSGTPVHTGIVEDMLSRAGLKVDSLQCGAHWPYHEATADAMRRRGERPTALHSNCSGKHAGMVAFARHIGTDPTSYRQPEHPVQRRIRRAVAAMTGVEEGAIALAVDGCGVPVFGLPLPAMATAFARLADPSGLAPDRQEAVRRIVAAMTANPELVGGPGRFDSVVMEGLRGRVLSKVGAEGIQCLAVPERGLGIAVKVLDGASRAAGPAALEILAALDVLSEPERMALDSERQPVVRNVAGDVVGEIRCQFALRRSAQVVS